MPGCVELNFRRNLIAALFEIAMKLETLLMSICMGMLTKDAITVPLNILHLFKRKLYTELSIHFNRSVVSNSLRPHGLQQASLSITDSRSLLKLMSIKSVMPSNHVILCHRTIGKDIERLPRLLSSETRKDFTFTLCHFYLKYIFMNEGECIEGRLP